MAAAETQQRLAAKREAARRREAEEMKPRVNKPRETEQTPAGANDFLERQRIRQEDSKKEEYPK